MVRRLLSGVHPSYILLARSMLAPLQRPHPSQFLYLRLHLFSHSRSSNNKPVRSPLPALLSRQCLRVAKEPQICPQLLFRGRQYQRTVRQSRSQERLLLTPLVRSWLELIPQYLY